MSSNDEILAKTTKVFVTSGNDRHCSACKRGLYDGHTEALTVIDGVPYYGHVTGGNLNELIACLQQVLDDHSVPTVAFFLVFGPMQGFGVS